MIMESFPTNTQTKSSAISPMKGSKTHRAPHPGWRRLVWFAVVGFVGRTEGTCGDGAGAVEGETVGVRADGIVVFDGGGETGTDNRAVGRGGGALGEWMWVDAVIVRVSADGLGMWRRLGRYMLGGRDRGARASLSRFRWCRSGAGVLREERRRPGWLWCGRGRVHGRVLGAVLPISCLPFAVRESS